MVRPRRRRAPALGALALLVLAAAIRSEWPLAATGPRPAAANQAQATLPTVFPGHPRLIVGGYRGVSVDELRAACARPELKAQCDLIGGQHILDDAMRYVLVGDTAAAGRVKATLLAWNTCGSDDVGVEHSTWGGHAIAYDWIWDTLTVTERRQMNGMWANCGLGGIRGALDGNGPHLWHGYTSLAASLMLMALACDVDHPGCEPLRQAAVDHFRGNALEAYAVVGGAWPEGYNYERSHFFSADPPGQYVMDALRAWDSAVEQDSPAHASLFDTIAADEGDWLRGLGYHVVYGTLDAYGPGGKRTLMRGGDMPTGQAYPNKQYRPFVDSIARVYGDGVLAKWGRDLESDWSFVGGEGTYHPIHRYSLPYNLPIDVASQAPDDANAAGTGGSLPLGRIWARNDLGYVIARSGWSAGETTLGYRAGKWFTGHQHMDQGHIDLWRKGPLAVDSGVYAAWGTEHREAYYMRTVAHNTLLIPRLGERFDQHPALGTPVNDGGQRVQTYTRAGCPQCMQSVAEWRSNVGQGLHFEAGRIDVFAEAPGYTVVESDLTDAYNSTHFTTPGNAAKVEAVQRDIVFLRPDLVLVTDRVRTTDGTSPPRFALHLPDRPTLDEVVVDAGTVDDGIVHTDTARFTYDNGTGGRLALQALWPNDARLTAIGGLGHRYWVDGANRDAGAGPHEGAPAEPGAWRVESASRSAAKAGRDFLLVHALTVTDTGRAVWPVWRRLASVNRLVGGEVHAIGQHRPDVDRIVFQSAAVPRQAVARASLLLTGTTPVRIEVLASDLVPSAVYVVCVEPCVQPRWSVRSDSEGIAHIRLDHAINVAGGVNLAIFHCPPDPRADLLWRASCAGLPPEATVTSSAPATATATATATPLSSTAVPTVPAMTSPSAGGRVWLPWMTRYALPPDEH